MTGRLDNLLARVQAFMRETAYPLEEHLRHSTGDAADALIATARAHAGDVGLWTLHLPEAWGGPGLSLHQFARISEELGRSDRPGVLKVLLET